MHLPEDKIVVRLRRTKHQTPADTGKSDTAGFSAPVIRMIRHRRQSIRVPRPLPAAREVELQLTANL
jgi:hypothetical protein